MPKTYDIEVRGHTYPHKRALQDLGLWWAPYRHAWIAWSRPQDQAEAVRDFCRRRNLTLTLKAPEYVTHKKPPALRRGQTTLDVFGG